MLLRPSSRGHRASSASYTHVKGYILPVDKCFTERERAVIEKRRSPTAALYRNPPPRSWRFRARNQPPADERPTIPDKRTRLIRRSARCGPRERRLGEASRPQADDARPTARMFHVKHLFARTIVSRETIERHPQQAGRHPERRRRSRGSRTTSAARVAACAAQDPSTSRCALRSEWRRGRARGAQTAWDFRSPCDRTAP